MLSEDIVKHDVQPGKGPLEPFSRQAWILLLVIPQPSPLASDMKVTSLQNRVYPKFAETWTANILN